ncbi:MAG: acetyl-CoA carboxylase biotin carboxyl carrier protein [candidate division Zixibacteria bacterium]|nr:acetyl-CoA carboxylase biotin carboxyl carrier protein [candidate division Zixibacteria bacterium]
MWVSKIRKLIKLVEESDIGELEVSGWGQRVRISKKPRESNIPASENPTSNITVETKPKAVTAAPAPAQAPTQEIAKTVVEGTDHLVPIKSPMVGTFYRAPAPDAKPYVELNQQIVVGQMVCIIEAMKLMNEIESEVAGRVAKILVENGKPVEFGQSLFLIEPA